MISRLLLSACVRFQVRVLSIRPAQTRRVLKPHGAETGDRYRSATRPAELRVIVAEHGKKPLLKDGVVGDLKRVEPLSFCSLFSVLCDLHSVLCLCLSLCLSVSVSLPLQVHRSHVDEGANDGLVSSLAGRRRRTPCCGVTRRIKSRTSPCAQRNDPSYVPSQAIPTTPDHQGRL